jgi:S-adenosylmethionine:tRNA ribosyltransferase-isomerase
VDAIVSGAHEAGSSHHELLRAFAAPAVLQRADRALREHGYLTHEFGDSVLIERAATMPLAGTTEVRRTHGSMVPS